MAEKKFKLKAEDIKELVPPMGGCMATDLITVEGMLVGFMYRDEPLNELDCGWMFVSGIEDQDYLDDPQNTEIYNVNTIANYDPAIIPYLNLPYGTELMREKGTNNFIIISQ
jgi:hypothetical protein